MKRIYCPSRGLIDWKALLAQPELHWRAGASAMALASCWEAAHGLPREIADMFADQGADPQLLAALIEHKVPLPGSSRGDSQSDLFALIRAGNTTYATTIEGKVDESFDKPLSKWLVKSPDETGDKPPTNKEKRLTAICEILGLSYPPRESIYYQLLHRTAAAVLEARRFKTDAACMIVHSFSPIHSWYEAFEDFVALFGAKPERGRLLSIMPSSNLPLYVGWATGDGQFLADCGQ